MPYDSRLYPLTPHSGTKNWALRSVIDFCAGSIISELGGFPVKEAKFRREMEKLRYEYIPVATFVIYHFQRRLSFTTSKIFFCSGVNFFSLKVENSENGGGSGRRTECRSVSPNQTQLIWCVIIMHVNSILASIF